MLHAVEGLYEVCCQGRDLRHERLSGRKRRLYGVLAPHKISEWQIYTCVCSYTDGCPTMHMQHRRLETIKLQKEKLIKDGKWPPKNS